jgi:hypothetical protein
VPDCASNAARQKAGIKLTARCVIDTVISRSVYDETCQTSDDGDETEGKYSTKGDLLALAQLQTVDDGERKTEHY